MITKLRDWKMLESNKLVPKNIDGRAEKLKQQNLKKFQQEIIDENIFINYSLDFSNEESKVKIIQGNCAIMDGFGHIPVWLKGITILGEFDCSNCNLKNLENCPEYVRDDFNCLHNLDLISFDGCPEYIGGDFLCDEQLFKSSKFPENVKINGEIRHRYTLN